MVPDVLHQMFESQPSLRGGGDDLAGGQDKAITASVPQLEGVGVLDAQVIGPVNAAATGLI